MERAEMIVGGPYAHTFPRPDGRVDPNREKWQILPEHLRNVGNLASAFLAGSGLEDVARRAGERHDLGKYSCAFQRRLEDLARAGTEDASNEPERVDHSSAGAFQSLLDRYLAESHGSLALPSAELAIAFSIAFHHGGLQDREELRRRLDRAAAEKRAGRSTLLDEAVAGGAPAEFLGGDPISLPRFILEGSDAKAILRRFEFAVRMVYSALLDSDFLDTERCMRPDQHEARPRADEAILGRLRSSLDVWLDAKKSTASEEVNRVRREVLNACRGAAEERPGLFTLTVPTGGGKTLSSLAFGLRHAARHGLRRVIVVIPYTSIIDQTASEYRKWLSACGVEGASAAMIEHHSGLDAGKETRESRLACENWDAPLIVTTSVQFFESLHARRSSSVRKLHRMARSVVVLDEVQTLPQELLQPCLDVLGHLVRDYGSTVVISTATQPALLEDIPKPGGVERIEGLHSLIGRVAVEIVPDHAGHFETLNRRVRYRWNDGTGAVPTLSWDELAERLMLAERHQAMAIVNTRGDARALFEHLIARSSHARHLSALMCPAHRRHELDHVRSALKRGEACLLVATQLVEAGVDIDFPTVYRAVAGLDSIVQAGGRCNREGRRPSGDVFIFIPSQGGRRPPTVDAAARLVEAWIDDDGPPCLESADVLKQFFKRLYKSGPSDARRIRAYRAELAFQKVAEEFKLIDDAFVDPVVVPYNGSREALDQLRDRSKRGRDRLRILQPYVVNVPRWAVDRMLRQGALEELEFGVLACRSDFVAQGGRPLYDSFLGLRIDAEPGINPDRLIQ